MKREISRRELLSAGIGLSILNGTTEKSANVILLRYGERPFVYFIPADLVVPSPQLLLIQRHNLIQIYLQ